MTRRRPWVAPAGACVFIAVVYGVFLGAAPGTATSMPGGAGMPGHHQPLAVSSAMVHDQAAPTAAKAARACSRVTKPRRMAQCEASVLPAVHSLADMGVPDYGGGPKGPARTRNLDSLHGPEGTPQHEFTITAAMGSKELDGRTYPVMTFNGTTPGPTLTVTQGDLVVVHLRNADIRRGVTIHWHGVDVPGREDGVAGVTQDAVLPGQEYTYRFVAPDAGTYWYHSHQDSLRQVRMGLVGAVVVEPAVDPGDVPQQDVVGMIHTYGPAVTLNGSTATTNVSAPPGTRVRVRFVNTDSGPAFVSASAPFHVVAIDGFDLEGPTDLTDTYVEIPAGGRADLEVTSGADAVRVGLLDGPSFVIQPQPGGEAAVLAPSHPFDPLSYGQAGSADAARLAMGRVTRSFDYRIGMRTGYLDGEYGNWFTINGAMIPNVPMFMVRSGDTVRLRYVNRTTTIHPMHLHGHHALVLSRNGRASTGSAWWVDSLEVKPGESYELMFVADNPGVWMFHCHNLPHARAGLVTHLMYIGVDSPYRMGRVSSRLVNQPE